MWKISILRNVFSDAGRYYLLCLSVLASDKDLTSDITSVASYFFYFLILKLQLIFNIMCRHTGSWLHIYIIYKVIHPISLAPQCHLHSILYTIFFYHSNDFTVESSLKSLVLYPAAITA